MNNVLFVLIDSTDLSFFKRYQNDLQMIHNELKKKLSIYDILVLGGNSSSIAEHNFQDLKSLYQHVSQHAKGRDIVVVDAFAGMISLEDTAKVLEYLRNNHYDICLTENLPEGIVPTVISCNFLDEFISYLEDEQEITSDVKELINWEYKGIDVGVYLSPSLLVMERISFLPINKMSIEYIKKYSTHQKLNLAIIESLVKQDSFLSRNYPQYIAIEISSLGDNFVSANHQHPDMEMELFRKLITEIDELAPEALISIGVWGDPLTHHQFVEMMSMLKTISNPILIESRSLELNKSFVDLILSRPNTEWITDISFTTEESFKTYKVTPYSLQEVKDFVELYKDSPNVWVRLTRTHQTESYIKSFLKTWNHFLPRVLITKADSFGKSEAKVVDLAPLKRHACYALRRELTILNNGDVLLCRQSNEVIGNIKNESLQTIWNKNNLAYSTQLEEKFNTCKNCSSCDDWWVWN